MMDADTRRNSTRDIRSSASLPAIILATLAFGLGSPASAQETGGTPEGRNGGLEYIIVTARKTEERLETVPFAISAFSAQNLETQNIRSLSDLANISPGFNFRSQSGGTSGRNDRSNFNINFRGLYLGNSTPVSQGGLIFVDGAPVINGQTPALNDVARVEVLKGPQSAYFGRSTFTGAVNFITKDPSNDWEGRLEVGAADYDSDRETNSFNAQILFTPTESLKIKAYGSYGTNIDGPAAQGAIRGS